MSTDQDWLADLHRSRRASERNWWAALALSIFLGLFGADRFYLGRPELGIAKLLTFGGLTFWWLGDVILLLSGYMRDAEARRVLRP